MRCCDKNQNISIMQYELQEDAEKMLFKLPQDKLKL